MKRLGLISKIVPAINDGGKWVRNPTVTTDRYVDDGELVYAEFKTGEEYEKANVYVSARVSMN
jgi:6-oxo-cyclohex-1-ene-carbonyl-CoA hydrolase